MLLFWLSFICCIGFLNLTGAEPNPPNWPSNVHVFDPSNNGANQAVLNQAFSQNGGHNPAFNGQFSNARFAFLFKPGTHNVQANVGFYTSIYGLGASPSDTRIGTVKVENGDFDYTGGALDNFWRSAENFQTGSTLWAVSQACPLRRVYVQGDLTLYQYNSGCCAGYASGGYLSDSVVTGSITSGSQQQWFTRNTNMGKWQGAVWNMVFVGNTGGVPGTHCGNTGGEPFTTVQQTPVVAEKPYITISPSGTFSLRVPNPEYNKVGPTTNFNNVKVIDFANVYVARDTDSVGTINSKLASGLHLVLSPGNYNLGGSIQITNPNTVVLGIGFPTLSTTNGQPVVVVGNVDGVRVAGLLLQAGRVQSSSLLQWGNVGYAGTASNPGVLSDVFARCGGPNNPSQYQVRTSSMVQINSGNVVFDNTWLWRADHDVSGNVVNSENPVEHGLVVNGNNVTCYALAVEHVLQDLVVWNGDAGRTYFYQSELPYDVTQANFGAPGYVGYRVSPNVRNHQAYGIGVYSFFRDHSVTTQNGIVTPSGSGIQIVNPFTKFLSGQGEITHVINNRGAAVHPNGNEISYVCN